MGGNIYSMAGSLGGAAIGAGANVIGGFVSNALAAEREAQAREENYRYGEMAAGAADLRTRNLYRDLYSPEAQIKQLKDAGLSPSLMYGNAGGISGQAGAQGTGAGGINPNVFGIQSITPIEGAQIGLMMAQEQKLKAETKNVEKDTDLKALEEEYNSLRNSEYRTEFNLTNARIMNNNGTETSVFEIAESCNNYDNFVKALREAAESASATDILDSMRTAKGHDTLRSIFLSAKEMKTELAELKESELSAMFQMDIVKAMKDEDFAKLNAQSAVAYLKSNIETATLNEEQKGAWNRMLDRMGEKGSTTRDIIVCLAMLLNNAATNWHFPNVVHRHTHNNNTINNIRK